MIQTLKDIKKILTDKLFVKKAIIGIFVLIFQFIIILGIAKIFDLDTGNSLYGLISISIIFATIVMFLIKIIYACRNKHPIVEGLYFAIAGIVFCIAIAWIVFIYYLVTGNL